jgi:hypothetical protein
MAAEDLGPPPFSVGVSADTQGHLSNDKNLPGFS